MKRNQSCDALVIGAGIGGLTAAAYLARAGLSVIVLEARNTTGGLCATGPVAEGFMLAAGVQTLYALDPYIVRDLKLSRRGLRFVLRDMPLVGLRPDGRHVVLTRDVHAMARALALHSKPDAQSWSRWRRSFEELARLMRPHWWSVDGARLVEDLAIRLEPFRRMGAAAWLDARAESDALKATLAFDAGAGGLSVLEPGSALALLWRSAQEMCGLQGAAAIPRGGPQTLAAALTQAAQSAGADIRTGARVRRILVSGQAVTGVQLASGDTIAAAHVLSSLSRRRTLCELLPETEIGFAAAAACERARPAAGTARIVITLDTAPAFGGIATPRGARFILADRLESYAAAHSAALAGRLPHDPPMEVTVPTAADAALAPPGQHVLTALVRPVPVAPQGGWKALAPELVKKVYAALAPHAPDLARHVTLAQVTPPDEFLARYGHEDASSGVSHILAPWQQRIATPLGGLMLCGAAAEPVPVVSGRAGRIAAAMILKEAKR